MSAIDKANDCDLKYRGSKNQRLLVELALMQIASITFDGAKKKSSNFIIPATFFTSLSPKEKVSPKTALQEKSIVKKQQPKVQKPIREVPQLKDVERRSSAFSLKNVNVKREAIKVQDDVKREKLLNEDFSLEQLKYAIKKYADELIKNKENVIASLINASDVSLHPNYEVQFEVPSAMNEDQLKKGLPKLLKSLRFTLKNHTIAVKIVVNETKVKRFVYTNQEKYEKMKEKNPLLEQFRLTFGLDI